MIEDRVQYWMTRDPLTVLPEETLLAAHARMQDAHVRHLPIIADNISRRVLGLLTLGGIRQAELEVAATYRDSYVGPLATQSKTVSELLKEEAVTIAPDDPLVEAARLMLAHKLTALPVVEDDQLVGIITESDIFGYLIELKTPERAGTK